LFKSDKLVQLAHPIHFINTVSHVFLKIFAKVVTKRVYFQAKAIVFFYNAIGKNI